MKTRIVSRKSTTRKVWPRASLRIWRSAQRHRRVNSDRNRSAIALLFSMLVLLTLVISSRPALADIDYDVASGDYNGDGTIDVLLLAKVRIIIIPYEVDIPILLRSDLPTIAFESSCSLEVPEPCVPDFWTIDYSLTTQDIENSTWDFSTYEIHRVDFDSDGLDDFFLRALVPTYPSFQFFYQHAIDIGNGGLVNVSVDQILTTSGLGVGLGEPGVEIAFEDRNADGVPDLVVSRDNMQVGIFLTNEFTGQIVLPANSGSGTSGGGDELADISDAMTIDEAWGGFVDALNANDAELASQYFTPNSESRYYEVFSLFGNSLSSLTSDWSPLKLIELTDRIATFTLHQDEDGVDRLHTVFFVRVPNRGWRIQDM